MLFRSSFFEEMEDNRISFMCQFNLLYFWPAVSAMGALFYFCFIFNIINSSVFVFAMFIMFEDFQSLGSKFYGKSCCHNTTFIIQFNFFHYRHAGHAGTTRGDLFYFCFIFCVLFCKLIAFLAMFIVVEVQNFWLSGSANQEKVVIAFLDHCCRYIAIYDSPPDCVCFCH